MPIYQTRIYRIDILSLRDPRQTKKPKVNPKLLLKIIIIHSLPLTIISHCMAENIETNKQISKYHQISLQLIAR
jgi:hypothetical protein